MHMNDSSKRTGLLLAALAAIFFGLSSITAKLASTNAGGNGISIAFYRNLSVLPVLAVILKVKGYGFKLTRKQLRDYKEYPLSIRILKALCRIDGLYSIYLKMLDNDRINWKFIVNQRKLRQIPFEKEEKDVHEKASQEEINVIISRIRSAIER